MGWNAGAYGTLAFARPAAVTTWRKASVARRTSEPIKLAARQVLEKHAG